eukprot:scaffold116598_cov66-Phaeocystis_antarctica.AAC.2
MGSVFAGAGGGRLLALTQWRAGVWAYWAPPAPVVPSLRIARWLASCAHHLGFRGRWLRHWCYSAAVRLPSESRHSWPVLSHECLSVTR